MQSMNSSNKYSLNSKRTHSIQLDGVKQSQSPDYSHDDLCGFLDFIVNTIRGQMSDETISKQYMQSAGTESFDNKVEVNSPSDMDRNLDVMPPDHQEEPVRSTQLILNNISKSIAIEKNKVKYVIRSNMKKITALLPKQFQKIKPSPNIKKVFDILISFTKNVVKTAATGGLSKTLESRQTSLMADKYYKQTASELKQSKSDCILKLDEKKSLKKKKLIKVSNLIKACLGQDENIEKIMGELGKNKVDTNRFLNQLKFTLEMFDVEKLKNEDMNDRELEHILKQLKNNDTEGAFRDLYYDSKNNSEEIRAIEDELEMINDFENMDAFEKTSYVVDKKLDYIDNTSNSMWSIGFSAGLIFPPMFGVSLVGGGLVLMAKASKITNNTLRGNYASCLEKNSSSETKKLIDQIEQLKNKIVFFEKPAQTLESHLKEIHLISVRYKDDPKTCKNELKRYYSQNDGVEKALEDLHDATNNYKKTMIRTTKQNRIKNEAFKEAAFDTLNFATWAVIVSSAGIAAQSTFTQPKSFINSLKTYVTDEHNLSTAAETPVSMLEDGSLFHHDDFSAGIGLNWMVNTICYYADINISGMLSHVIHGKDNEKLFSASQHLKNLAAMVDSIPQV